MQNSCPSCGAETFPGARFCRRCGAPVGAAGGEDSGDVSPHASTIPLAGEEPRTTDGLTTHQGRVSPQTSRVSIAEMERILRAQDEAPLPPTPPQAPQPEAALNAHSPAATRPDFPAAEYDEELTITVPRPQTRETGDFEATADFEETRPADMEATRPSSPLAPQVGAWPYGGAGPREGAGAGAEAFGADAASVGGHDAAGDTAAGPGVAAAGTPPRRRAWLPVVAVCAAVLIVAAGGAWLAFSLLRRPAITDVPTQPPSAPPAADARQQFEEKLAEAEALLAAGDMEGALRRLREANQLDPANTRAHQRLGELLLSTGARREAIEELRAVVRNAPEDFTAWRQLAAAQFAEGLHRDAADSYRRLVALVGEQAADPADLLNYADALRLSGRAEESRLAYERLAAAAPAEVAAAARQRLAELARAQPTPSPAEQPGVPPGEQQPPRVGEAASAGQPSAQPTPAQPPPPQPAPTPAPAAGERPAAASPSEHYTRGVGLWPSNRAAALAEFRAAASGGNHDAHYYLGLSYVEGRSAGSLKRAEIVAALQHFQLAQRGGRHAAQARGHAQQLEKEFDRLRKQ